jgi:ATP-grasp domain, R2K clade family 2
VIYVEGLFAPAIAQTLRVRLLTPDDSWLMHLPDAHRQREVRLTTLAEARTIARAAFVKPPNDKSFEARVYESGEELPTEFDDNMAVLVAEPVVWQDEFRCFALDGNVRTLSPYLRGGRFAKLTDYSASATELDQARRFAEEVLANPPEHTPRALVLDVGTIAGRGWAVVEANGAWGSGIYGCDPDAVLDVIRCATVPAD